MVSRENAIVVVCIALALVLGYGGFVLTALPDEAVVGVLLFVGVVAPMAINSYLDDEGES